MRDARKPFTTPCEASLPGAGDAEQLAVTVIVGLEPFVTRLASRCESAAEDTT